EHEEEKKRIAKLVWWDEVAAGVPGFPGSDVYHINPIGLVGNFLTSERRLTELIRKIGDIISGGEGGYESYNTGTNGVHGAVGHSYMTKPKGTVTGKTINEILATEHFSYMNPARFYTTGKYQTIIPTLREGKARLGLTGDEKYDEDAQERMFSDFLIFHAGGGVLAKFIGQGVGTLDDAQYAASKEWASIAAPAGCRIKDGRISDGSLSYYEGANNHAYMPSTNRLRSTLAEISQSR
ncbi:muramidase, partial [Burkholderia sp. JPY481]